jgi:hypothetical protein
MDANANIDEDCMPECGNGVVETGELCDGGPDCDRCMLSATVEQLACRDAIESASGACEPCTCLQCPQEALQCLASGNAQRDADCAELFDCSLESGCRGSQCWCGFGTDPDGTCLTGNGPCKDLLDRIAGTPGPLSVYNQQFDLNTAIGRARALTMCLGASCLDECP